VGQEVVVAAARDAVAACDDVVVRLGGKRVLGPLTVSIAPGELWGVVGPNGAGKTTLLRTLAGMEPIAGGALSVAGRPIGRGPRDRRPDLRRDVAYLMQHHDFHRDLPFSVADVVAFGRIGRVGIGRRQDAADQAAVDHAIDLLGLEELRRRLYRELSGGQRQKVQRARVVAQEASLVLLDEPASGLDLDWRERLTALVDLVHRSSNAALIMVTHEVDHLPQSSDNVLLLQDGRVLASGAPETVLHSRSLSALYGCEMVVVAEGGRFHAHSRRLLSARDRGP